MKLHNHKNGIRLLALLMALVFTATSMDLKAFAEESTENENVKIEAAVSETETQAENSVSEDVSVEETGDNYEDDTDIAKTEDSVDENSGEVCQQLTFTSPSQGGLLTAEDTEFADLVPERLIQTSNVTEFEEETVGTSESDEQIMMERVQYAFENQLTSISFSDLNISIEDGSKIYGTMVRLPRNFIVDSTKGVSIIGTASSRLTSISGITYIDNAATLLQQYDIAFAVMEAGVDSSWSDLEKLLYVNDYMDLLCEYDTDESNTAHRYDAYGVMVDHDAVCQGYAEAVWQAMSDLGIDCCLVTSYNINHAWDAVKINGQYYMIDTTWNDPVADKLGRACHTYFLNSYTSFAKSHASAKGKTEDFVYNGSLTDSDVNDTRFDNYFWQKYNSPFICSNGKYYNVTVNSNYATCLKTFTVSGNGETWTNTSTIQLFSDLWYVYSNGSRDSSYYYTGCYSNLLSYGGKVYLNSPSKILVLTNLATGSTSTFYTSNSTSGDIVGIANSGNELYCSFGTPESYTKQKLTTLSSGSTTQYTLVFNANGGSCSTTSKTLDAGSNYGTLPTPTRANYTFAGWYTAASGGTQVTSSNVINGDTVVYAHWNVAQYTLTFNANGGTCSTVSRTLDAGSTYGTLPTPTRTYYTFAGWYTAASGGSQVTASKVISGNTTIYAHWTAITYTLTFNANGGTCSTVSKSVNAGNAYDTLPTPTRTDYTFAGWYTAASGGSQVTSSTIIKGNTTIYAHWTTATYTLTFDANGGTCSTASRTLNAGDAYGTLPTPTRSGYYFDGWYTAASGGSQVSASTVITGNTTVYAHWTAVYTLTFNANGGTCSTSSRIIDKGDTCGDLPTPYRSGYTFSGWYTAVTGGSQISSTTILTGDTTVYAHWAGKQPAAAPKANVSDSAAVDYGTQVTLSCSTLGSSIYYTLDGTAPTSASLLYTEPIVLTQSLTLRAIATYPGMNDSAELTLTYTVNPQAASQGDVEDEDLPDGATLADQIANIPSGFWAGNLEDQTYTGAALKPAFNVYYGNHKLVLGKDYTLSYKNNTKACDATSKDSKGNLNGPYALITGKGNYSGSKKVYFTIRPVELTEDTVTVENTAVAYKASGNQKPAFTVKMNGKALKANTDYTLSWNNEAGTYNGGIKTDGTYAVTISGKGNYTGSISADFTVSATDEIMLSKTKISISNVSYTTWEDQGEELTESQLVLKNGSYILQKDIDYTVEYRNASGIGTAMVIITAAEDSGYTGSLVKTFQIIGTSIKSGYVIGGIAASYSYTGNEICPTPILTKKNSTEALEADTDYTVSYKNNTKAGTATLTLTGTGAYTGSLSKTYKIAAYDLSQSKATDSSVTNGEITVSYDSDIKYIKGGSKVPVTVTYSYRDSSNITQTITLTEGSDYTLTYKNYTKSANSGATDSKGKRVGPNFVITGKGNFTGSMAAKYYSITSRPLTNSDIVMTAKDVTVSASPKKYTTTVTLTDNAASTSTALKIGTDYNKTLTYSYAYDTANVIVVNGSTRTMVTRSAKTVVSDQDIIPAGTVIRVTATATYDATNGHNYDGSKSTTFRVLAANKDISKAKVTVDTREYTEGQAYCPDKSNITVKLGSGKNAVTLTDSDYTIASYSKNTASGTATVTLKGQGNYGGTITAKYTIGKRSMTTGSWF